MKDGVESGIKTVMIAAGIVITLIVVTIAFFILNQGKNTISAGVSKVDKMNNQMAESDITMYDGLEVSGTDVVNAINKFKSDKTRLAVYVETGKNTAGGGTWYLYNGNTIDSLSSSSSNLSDATDPTKNSTYVTPNGRFKGTVTRDSNGTIAVLSFKQLP